MDTGDARVGRATDLVGPTSFWAATGDRTARLKRITDGKVLGGWECKSCEYLHSQFENMEFVCFDCGADRVRNAGPTTIRNEVLRSSSDQYNPPIPSLSPPMNAASCATPSPAKKPRTTAKREAIARKENKNKKLFQPRNHQ